MAKTVVTPIKMLTDKPHVRVFSEGLGRLAVDRELTLTDKNVLLFLISVMEYENLLNITQKALSEELGIVQPEVSKSIKKLIKGGYLRIVDKNGRQNVYQLNPHIGFKSRAKNYNLLCTIWDEDQSQPDDSLEA
jgi:DNA-binding transcriptional regulator LsrR (DeoR family)